MTTKISIGMYDKEVLGIMADKRKMSISELIASFFEPRCNAPDNFGKKVQCTDKPKARTNP